MATRPPAPETHTRQHRSQSTAPLAVPPGTLLIGTYEILEHLNTGGMGEVYRGVNIHNDEVVAIKIVLPALAHDETILSLFQKESTVLRRIAHDAIVRYEVFTRDPVLDRPCLIMEYAEGPSLGDRLEHQPLNLTEVFVILKRLTAGLEVAHRGGVVHRDLSPDNVILCDNDVAQAKIIDFGIAKANTPGGRTLIGGQFAGKPGYVAPEQLGLYDGHVTGQADIYSLGLLAAAAALGYPLDMGDTPASAVMARMKVPDLGGIDPELVPLLEWMLQPDPAGRPATMADISAWISTHYSDLIKPDAPPAPTTFAQPAPSRSVAPARGGPAPRPSRAPEQGPDGTRGSSAPVSVTPTSARPATPPPSAKRPSDLPPPAAYQPTVIADRPPMAAPESGPFVPLAPEQRDNDATGREEAGAPIALAPTPPDGIQPQPGTNGTGEPDTSPAKTGPPKGAPSAVVPSVTNPPDSPLTTPPPASALATGDAQRTVPPATVPPETVPPLSALSPDQSVDPVKRGDIATETAAGISASTAADPDDTTDDRSELRAPAAAPPASDIPPLAKPARKPSRTKTKAQPTQIETSPPKPISAPAPAPVSVPELSAQVEAPALPQETSASPFGPGPTVQSQRSTAPVQKPVPPAEQSSKGIPLIPIAGIVALAVVAGGIWISGILNPESAPQIAAAPETASDVAPVPQPEPNPLPETEPSSEAVSEPEIAAPDPQQQQAWLDSRIAAGPPAACSWLPKGSTVAAPFGFAADPVAFAPLLDDYEAAFSQPLPLVLYPLAPAQCPAFERIALLEQGRPPSGRLGFTLPESISRTSEAALEGQLRGELQGHLTVLMIDPAGRVQNITDLVEGGGFRLAGPRVTPPPEEVAVGSAPPVFALLAFDTVAPLPVMRALPGNAILPTGNAEEFWSFLGRDIEALSEPPDFASGTVIWSD